MPPRPLHIFTHEFAPTHGGIAVYVEELARAGAGKYGAGNVTVWAPSLRICKRKQNEKNNKGNGEDVSELPFNIKRMPQRGTHGPISILRCAWVFCKNLKTFRQTRAHICLAEPAPMLALALVCRLLGVRALKGVHVTCVLHGSEIERFAARPIEKHSVQRLLARVNAVGVVSHYNAGILLRRFSAIKAQLRSKLAVVPGALRHNFINAAEAAHNVKGNDNDKNNSNKKSEQGTLTVLTLGRVHPRKGQLATLRALAALPSEIAQRTVYRIVGPVVDSQYAKALQTLAQQVQASQGNGLTVEFAGAVALEALPGEFANADVFALTSMPHKKSIEGFGLVYVEAGAYSLPSIAHAIGGVPEAVGQGGLLVNPGDRPALTAAFAKVLGSPSVRGELGATAKANALRHTWADVLAALEKEKSAAQQTEPRE